jgi:hypothetical protein
MYTKGWAARMTTLVECWNKLDGNVGELSSWVATKVCNVHQRVGSKDHHIGGVLEQSGRKCWRAQLMGGHKGTFSLKGGRRIIVSRLREQTGMKYRRTQGMNIEGKRCLYNPETEV